jgi:hypothetical protein
VRPFHGNAYFVSVTFGGNAHFQSATFRGQAAFQSAALRGHAHFVSATFSGWAVFGKVTFSGDADFASATFSDLARFQNATYDSNALFMSANFRGFVDFVNVEMNGPTTFDDVVFSEPPICFNAKLHEGTTWHRAKLPKTPSDPRKAEAFADAYKRLKLEMDRLKVTRTNSTSLLWNCNAGGCSSVSGKVFPSHFMVLCAVTGAITCAPWASWSWSSF